jgi:hypothetical protein
LKLATTNRAIVIKTFPLEKAVDQMGRVNEISTFDHRDDTRDYVLLPHIVALAGWKPVPHRP